MAAVRIVDERVEAAFDLGKVTTIEFEPELAARAKANLTPYRSASVVEGDGSSVAFDAADVIYVNAGATRPCLT